MHQKDDDGLYAKAILKIESLEKELAEAERYIADLENDLASTHASLRLALRLRPMEEKDWENDA